MKKVVLITGGSRGIGKTTALLFAENGFDIVFTYLTNEKKAKETKKEIENMGSKCLVVKCDISKETDIENLKDKVFDEFEKIDVLVNNAAISIDKLFSEKTGADFKKVLETNLVGTFLMSKTFGEKMVEQKGGKIINISSTNGINTYFPMCLDYDASKSGIISLSHNLAMQFSPYVNVNVVAPGFIATESEIKDMDEEFVKMEEEKIFLKRAGTEKEVAEVILFLASDKANYINSAVIRVDGGMYGE